MEQTKTLCTERCGHQEKQDWPIGAWSTEPDRVDFQHAGFACLLHRNRVGAWCGYVGLPPGHPLHGLDYEKPDIEVHGGLTYAGHCSPPICHVPEPGEPDDLWWFGFDCAHAYDAAPRMLAFEQKRGYPPREHEVYRDVAYARAETEKLADQLAALL